MHDHEFDLIAQLAEGSLLAGHLAVAEAAVASCAECRSEYEAQVFALEALAGAETARLTEFERARLHRSISEATTEPRAPVPVRRASLLSTWVPRLAVAAAAVAFVGVVGVGLGNRGADGGDATDTAAEAVAADEATSDTTIAAAGASPEVAASTEMLEAAEEAASSDSNLALESNQLAAVPLRPLNLGTIDQNDFADIFAERVSPGAVPERSGVQAQLQPFPFACVGTAVGTYGEEEDLTVAGIAVLDGRLVEVLGFSDLVLAFDRENCEPVASSTLSP